ncbi:UNKNOWN [Stylonychia lemnae]|uniref:Uncharacterized protein n=1 Tax=Stylonychia lemnae TaxID=5949 RepID=A0A078AI99_STYLE|nr:UNKNOWN [Stylonychia lemnae]|eukprot:CDW81934.1 UNKNOWN [Stylonychia lemnae]
MATAINNSQRIKKGRTNNYSNNSMANSFLGNQKMNQSNSITNQSIHHISYSPPIKESSQNRSQLYSANKSNVKGFNLNQNVNYSQDRMKNLQILYEERLSQMQTQLNTIYTKIANDEIANTMKENSVSQEFIIDRIKEIMEETVLNEKEMQIEKNIQEISLLKSELAAVQNDLYTQSYIPQQIQDQLDKEIQRSKYLEQENNALKEKMMQLSTGFQQTDSSFKSIIIQKDEELNFCKQQFKQCKAQLDQYEVSIQDKQKQTQQLQQELYQVKRLYQTLQEEFDNKKLKFDQTLIHMQEQSNELQLVKTQNFDMQLQIQRLVQEYQNQQEQKNGLDQEKQELMEKFNNYGEHLQRQQVDQLEKAKQQFQDKLAHYKGKIQDLKDKEEQYAMEIEKERKLQYDLKNNFELIISNMREDMRRIKEEWEHRLQDEELEHQRQIVTVQSQQAIQVQNMKHECTLIFDQKMSQLQREQLQENERLKRECEELKNNLNQKIVTIEKDYIKVQKHEEILNQELQRLDLSIHERVKKIKEQMQAEISQRLEERENEREKVTQQIIKKAKEQYEAERGHALQEQEQRIIKQYDWQIKEMKEEHAHELRSLQKKSDIQKEDIIQQNQRLSSENGYLKNDLLDKNHLLQEIRQEIENERVNEQRRIEEQDQDNQALRNECERLQEIIEVTKNEFQIQINDIQRQTENDILNERSKWQTVIAKIQKITSKQFKQFRKQLDMIREIQSTEYSSQFNKMRKTFFEEFIRCIGQNNIQEQLMNTIHERENFLQQVIDEKQQIEQEYQRLHQQFEECEQKLAKIRKDRVKDSKNIKNEFIKVLETAKREVQRKYSDELKVLNNSVKEFNKRFRDEIITKEKEVKQLHLQHSLEKSHLQDQLNLSNSKIKTLSIQLQECQNRMEKERQHLDSQKKGWIEEFKKKYQFKEKEIEGLTSLITKSYQSINSTIDNIRVAAKIESEVEELTRKAKEKNPLRSESSQRSIE